MSNEKRPLTPQAGFDPYRVPESSESLEEVHSDDLIQAERGTRLVARLVDGVVYAFAAGAIAAGYIFSPTVSDSAVVTALMTALGGMVTLGILGVNLMWLANHGQTIGKRAMGIAIVRSDGTQATLGRLIGMRWFIITAIGYIPGVGLLVGLLNPLMIFRQDHRCLHDHIADTIVVRAAGR